MLPTPWRRTVTEDPLPAVTQVLTLDAAGSYFQGMIPADPKASGEFYNRTDLPDLNCTVTWTRDESGRPEIEAVIPV